MNSSDALDRALQRMRRVHRLFLPHCAIWVALLACTTARASAQGPYTVPGPEAEDLVERTTGVLVMTQPVGGLRTLQLPKLTWASPRPPDQGNLPVFSVTGPDDRGTIALIENEMVNARHALELLDAEGHSTQVFAHEGDALWGHAVGKHLALNSQGRRAALVARTEGVQLRDPDAYLQEGELEVWNLAGAERLPLQIHALDDTLAWFPDGRHLAYTALIDPDDAATLWREHVGDDDTFGRATLGWKRVAVVHVLDVETGQTEKLHLGQRPLVSPDGRSLLLRDFELHWRLLDIESNRSKPIEAPGAIYPGAIGFVDPVTVLYWAWPTAGGELGYTENNSPLVGEKQMRALKLFDLETGRFQTVLPQADPRGRVSFGRGAPEKR